MPTSRQTVIMVSHTARLGGAERSLLELAAGLGAYSPFRPVLAAPQSGELLDAAHTLRLDVAVLPPLTLERLRTVFDKTRALGRIVRTAHALSRLCRAEHAAVVHANGVKALLPATLAAFRLRLPCVWHVRDYPDPARSLRPVYRAAARVVAPSEYLRNALIDLRLAAASRIAVVPNAVDGGWTPSTDATCVRTEFGIPAGAPLITMVAQMAPWKRHDLFLHAAMIVARDHPEARFLIVGSDISGANPEYCAEIRALAQTASATANVILAGQRGDVPAILGASDVLVLPSEREPFGRVIIEGWRCGVPAIVSAEGGPAELVTDGVNGLHFQPRDAVDLARKLCRMLNQPNLSSQLRKACEEAATPFRQAHCCRAVADIYAALIEAH